jgi:hypothetical protein
VIEISPDHNIEKKYCKAQEMRGFTERMKERRAPKRKKPAVRAGFN